MPEPTVFKFDNTKLDAYRTCPMKGFYRHGRGLVGKESYKPLYFEMGEGIHRALNSLYSNKDLFTSMEVFTNYYDEVYYNHPYGDEKRTPERGREMLEGYWKRHVDFIKSTEVLAIERYFEMELANIVVYGSPISIIYCGRIDMILRDHRFKKVIGMDHKTTSFLTEASISSLRGSNQLLGYNEWILSESEWKDQAGEFFYVDFLLTTKSSKFSQDGLPYIREPIASTEALRKEWRAQSATIAEMVVRWTLQPDSDSMWKNTGACNNYNSLCPYHVLCTTDPGLRESTISMLYDVEWWNPEEKENV